LKYLLIETTRRLNMENNNLKNTFKTDAAATKKTDTSASFGADHSGLQEKIMKQIRELGDSLERAGEKVEKNGWETIGQAISKLGNSLEHMNDKSDVKKAGVSGSKPYTDKEFDDKTKKSTDLKASANKVGGNDSQAY
jgi:hypothetical protein